jgi:hypothetical protein
MNTKGILLLLSFAISLSAQSQTPVIEWTVNDSNLVDIAIDQTGNILALKQLKDGYEVTKFGNHGSTLWSISDTLKINDPQKIMVDHSGNITVAGNKKIFAYTVTVPVGQEVYKTYTIYDYSFCLIKYDESGNLLNYINYKSAHSVDGLQIHSIATDSKNNFYINATIADSAYIDTCLIALPFDLPQWNKRIFIATVNAEGSFINLKEFPYTVSLDKCIIDANDNLIVTGTNDRKVLTLDNTHTIENYGDIDGIIIKYDAEGKVVWGNNIGSPYSDFLKNITSNKNGQLLFSIYNNAATGRYDNNQLESEVFTSESYGSEFICKTGGDGKLLWYRQIIETDPYFSKTKISTSGLNNLLSLTFNANLQYDNIKINTPDRYGSCVLKIDSTGNLIWFKQFDFGNNFNGIDEALSDENEDVIVMGSYRFTGNATKEKFICKLLNDSIYVTNSQITEKHLLIYPNPATNIITINSIQDTGRGALQIYNITGKEIWKQDFKEGSKTIDISSFSKGIYLVKLTTGRSTFTGKISKE